MELPLVPVRVDSGTDRAPETVRDPEMDRDPEMVFATALATVRDPVMDRDPEMDPVMDPRAVMRAVMLVPEIDGAVCEGTSLGKDL